jgi:hypothetical protein
VNKNSVRGVTHLLYNYMEKAHYPSNDSVAWFATILTYGKYLLTDFYTNSIGSNYGLLKAAPLSYFVSYPVTVSSKSPVSRITGSNKLQKRRLTTTKSDTLFMMPLIFTRMAA